MTQRQKRHIWEMLPIFIIALALVVYCCTAALSYGRLNASIATLDSGWMLNGQAVDALPARDVRARGETSVMQTRLPEAFEDAQSVAFYSSYADVRVLLNGRCLYSLSKPENEHMTSCAPSRFVVFSLPRAEASLARACRLSLHRSSRPSDRPCR